MGEMRLLCLLIATLVSSNVTLDVEVQVFQALDSEMHIVAVQEVSAFEGALLFVSLIQRLCFP